MNDENTVPAGGAGKPISARKLASSRANGAKSKGPKTEAGKRRSSQNSIKHGLAARAILLANEDHAEFGRLHAAYLDYFQPRNPVELDLVEEIVIAKWRQCRLWTIESAQIDLELVRQRPAVDRQFEAITEDVRTALAFEEKAKPGDPFLALNRYEARLSRQYHRALRTLTELQQNRPPAQAPSEPATDNRQLTTEELPNEPNPDSEHQPQAQAALSSKSAPNQAAHESTPTTCVHSRSFAAGGILCSFHTPAGAARKIVPAGSALPANDTILYYASPLPRSKTLHEQENICCPDENFSPPPPLPARSSLQSRPASKSA